MYFKILCEYLALVLSLGTEVKFVKHLTHDHSIIGFFKALFGTIYEIYGLLELKFKEQ